MSTGTERTPLSFTFGDPEPVLSSNNILDYLECWQNGRYFEPPLSLEGLARSTRASVHLDSGLKFRRNKLLMYFIPHKLLSRQTFDRFALDYLWSGNAYLEKRTSLSGQLLSLQPTMAKYMRRGIEENSFFQLRGFQQEHEFKKGSIIHIFEPDMSQEIYGVPDWISALQSALLNEGATLFRRRYFENGSHAGFILYMNDAAHNEEDVKSLRTALKSAKGPGNFRNLFMYSPGGKKDGIQVIPVSEVSAKDEFNHIKDVTRDDVLGALRIPPQLMGIVPKNAGGFGSIAEATTAWENNELVPMQERLKFVNELVGEEVVRFRELADYRPGK